MGENTIGKIFPALRENDMLQYGEHGEKSGKRESGKAETDKTGSLAHESHELHEIYLPQKSAARRSRSQNTESGNGEFKARNTRKGKRGSRLWALGLKLFIAWRSP